MIRLDNLKYALRGIANRFQEYQWCEFCDNHQFKEAMDEALEKDSWEAYSKLEKVIEDLNRKWKNKKPKFPTFT